ncbi:MAG: hypothetical protein LBP62_04700 [Clostridiales bacterium]|jgi:hypothetical protein|nr:hypothetical protein [Clostridiales bacterium]
MSKFKRSIVGKIGFCKNKDLGINKKGGHYVYIRDFFGDKCNVNVVTSLENKNEHLKTNRVLNIKKGYTYPIPLSDSNFTLWSGINYDTIKNVKTSNIINIGKRYIKRKHKFFVGKFSK